MRAKIAHSTWYSRHREEAKRKKAIWAMVHREQLRRKAKKRQRLLKQHLITPQARERVGNTYINLGFKTY
jgi:hypothetical protein